MDSRPAKDNIPKRPRGPCVSSPEEATRAYKGLLEAHAKMLTAVAGLLSDPKHAIDNREGIVRTLRVITAEVEKIALELDRDLAEMAPR